MARQDVDAVRRFYSSWTNSDLAGMLEVADPAIDAVPVLGLLVKRTAEVDGGVIAELHLVAHQGGRSSDARIGVLCKMRNHKIVSITGRDADEMFEELEAG